jgi:hypothetical protein
VLLPDVRCVTLTQCKFSLSATDYEFMQFLIDRFNIKTFVWKQQCKTPYRNITELSLFAAEFIEIIRLWITRWILINSEVHKWL